MLDRMTYHGPLDSTVSRWLVANETLAPCLVTQLQAVQNIQRHPQSELLQVLLPLLHPEVKSTDGRRVRERERDLPRIKE